MGLSMFGTPNTNLEDLIRRHTCLKTPVFRLTDAYFDRDF